MTRQRITAHALRTQVTGIYALEAGVELLIGHDMFLRRAEFCDRFLTHTTTDDPVLITNIDWPALSFALDNGHLPYSSGELKILRLAASLADNTPLSLRDNLTGLDRDNVDLLITAIRHATGQRPPTWPT
jgi:hypothetical protein